MARPRRTKPTFYSILITVLTAGILLLQQQLAPPDADVKSSQTTKAGYSKVISVSDGDTIRVDISGKTETVRLIGVDTPETRDPRKSVECFGQAASNFTKTLIGVNDVRLEPDSQSSERDRYGRLLRYVYLPDGSLVQAEIIKQGYGYAYTSFPFEKEAEFVGYQSEAMQANRGLWQTCPQQ